MAPTRRDILKFGTVGAAGLIAAGCRKLPAGVPGPGHDPTPDPDPAPALRVAGEWEPHTGCFIAWPHRRDLWGRALAGLQREYVDTIETVARFEPVTVIAAPGQTAAVRAAIGGNIEILEAPYDDTWTRDTLPFFVETDGRIEAVDCGFNAWGRKFSPWDDDDALPGPVCNHLGIGRVVEPMVLEGGAVSVDGAGTLITTEQCLLNPNRNGSMTREAMEAVFASRFGIEKVIWLPYGLWGDKVTDGHIDGVAVFAGPARVVAMTQTSGPDAGRLAENLNILRSSTDALGRPLEVVEMTEYPELKVQGEWTAHTYINFYLPDGAVVVPLAGLRRPDDAALGILREAFPRRQVVGVEAPLITWGGGGIHCITHEVPTLAA